MLDLLNKYDLKDKLSRDFVLEIVPFISDIDMRLLINIFHEYKVYLSCILPSQEIANKEYDCRFAMILYKNLYPDDFALLSQRAGKLYAFISKKNEYIKSLVSDIEGQIANIRRRLDEIKKEHLTSVRELRAIYVNEICCRIDNGVSQIRLSDKGGYLEKYSLERILEDGIFDLFLLQKNEEICYNIYRGDSMSRSNVRFDEIENEIGEYKVRENVLLEKIKKKDYQLKQEQGTLEEKLNEIKGRSIEEIFQEINIDEHCNIFENDPIIRMLLNNGYINEHYESYISLFHDGEITQVDELYRRKLISGEHCPFDLKLSHKIGNLIKQIPVKYFVSPRVTTTILA